MISKIFNWLWRIKNCFEVFQTICNCFYGFYEISGKFEGFQSILRHFLRLKRFRPGPELFIVTQRKGMTFAVCRKVFLSIFSLLSWYFGNFVITFLLIWNFLGITWYFHPNNSRDSQALIYLLLFSSRLYCSWKVVSKNSSHHFWFSFMTKIKERSGIVNKRRNSMIGFFFQRLKINRWVQMHNIFENVSLLFSWRISLF